MEGFASCYGAFSAVYDRLMEDIPYGEWKELLLSLLARFGIHDGLVAELGCGTGTMTELLAEAGYDMIGIDNSEQMLSQAMEKRVKSGHDILYLLQDMREFELYGTVRAIVSVCDSMNYLADTDELLAVLKLAANYLDPGGVFIFDLKTDRYYRGIGDASYSDSDPQASYIWENSYDEESRTNCYWLTLFLPESASGQSLRRENASNGSSPHPDDAGQPSTPGTDAGTGLYRRYEEYHEQHAFLLPEITQAVDSAGLTLEDILDEQGQPLVLSENDDTADRIYVVARKLSKPSKV